LRLHLHGNREALIVEGFLSGFSLAPKPLKGVELRVIEGSVVSLLPIKDVLLAITTAEGLSRWLGQSTEFLCHVGIKFAVTVGEEGSKAVFTTVDLPRRLAFMVEALGEFEFQMAQVADGVQVNLKVRRALEPGAEVEWSIAIQERLSAFEGVMQNG
jgi:hypothetical protein